MHKSSYRGMRRNIGEYFPRTPMVVADLGSYDVNGSYKDLVVPAWEYVGLDRQAGPNVDIVIENENIIPVQENHFDSLISGQCFEHVKNPFTVMREVSRIVRPGGMVLVVAPFIFAEHRYPVDCWRFLRDGWVALFEEAGIATIKTEYVKAHKGNVDSWAIGRVR